MNAQPFTAVLPVCAVVKHLAPRFTEFTGFLPSFELTSRYWNQFEQFYRVFIRFYWVLWMKQNGRPAYRCLRWVPQVLFLFIRLGEGEGVVGLGVRALNNDSVGSPERYALKRRKRRRWPCHLQQSRPINKERQASPLLPVLSTSPGFYHDLVGSLEYLPHFTGFQRVVWVSTSCFVSRGFILFLLSLFAFHHFSLSIRCKDFFFSYFKNIICLRTYLWFELANVIIFLVIWCSYRFIALKKRNLEF